MPVVSLVMTRRIVHAVDESRVFDESRVSDCWGMRAWWDGKKKVEERILTNREQGVWSRSAHPEEELMKRIDERRRKM